jgi:Transposase and inactivated derivatives
MTERYAKNSGAVFSLKYHLVWCPKYRKPVLVPPVDARLKELIGKVAAENEMTVHALEVMPDHVHVFVETDVRRAPAQIARLLKGTTSNRLRQEFKHLRSKLPTLWSRSYFMATVGTVSEATVRRYIEAQKGK